MTRYRLSFSALADITEALNWSFDNFGPAAEHRYAALIATAIRHAADSSDTVGFRHHPEYGEGVMTWHLSLSATKPKGRRVRHPRHLLVCRREGDVLAIGRLLHDAMDPFLNLDARQDWT